MTEEVMADVEHLVRYGIGYDVYRDEMIILPFVYDPQERQKGMAALEAYPVTKCGTIEVLYLRRSGNLAGILASRVREIVYHAQQAKLLTCGDITGMDSVQFLGLAEQYAHSLAEPGVDISARTREIDRIRHFLQKGPVHIPKEVAALVKP